MSVVLYTSLIWQLPCFYHKSGYHEPDTTQLCPSHYAIHKLIEHDYIELYYFMLEGCTAAVKLDCTIAQDAFTFAKADDTLLLKPMALHKLSSKVIPDEDLTWRQMSIARTYLLHHMAQASWPEPHIIALAEFYLHLESHPMWLQVDGDTVLLHYQAQIRHEWHEALQATSDEPRGQSGRHHTSCPARHGHHSPNRPNRDRLSPPPRDTKRCHTTKSISDTQQSFQTGAAGNGAMSACTICLG